MDTLCLILAIIGAINWGLVGFARFDLVAWIFCSAKKATRRHKKRLPCHEGASFFHTQPAKAPLGGEPFL